MEPGHDTRHECAAQPGARREGFLAEDGGGPSWIGQARGPFRHAQPPILAPQLAVARALLPPRHARLGCLAWLEIG